MMEQICKGCGKPYEATRGNQRYCGFDCIELVGKSHKTKPAGWLYRGVCSGCGKQFVSDHKMMHCSGECRYQHSLDKAKEVRLNKQRLPCKQCGRQLPMGKITFCSDACQARSRKKTDIIWTSLTDKTVRQRIAARYDHIEHVSGHSTGGILIVRCKVCRGEFQITEQCSRKIMKLPCPYCTEAGKLLEKETAERNRLMNRLAVLVEKRQKSLRDAENRKKHCVVCGKEFIQRHGNQLICSEDCTQKQKNRAKKQARHTRKVRKKCNGEIDRSISLEKLITRDKNTCHICGHRCDSHDFMIDANSSYIAGVNHPSIDHVMPLSKGGSHTWDNVKLAHHRCNSQKSDLLCYERANGQMALAI